jgi:membrane-associated protein
VNTFLPLLISWLQLYGYPALGLSIFIAAVGIPLPVSFVLLAAGAFAALGDFNIVLLLLISVTAATCGDCAGYWIGRFGGGKFLPWLALRKRSPLLPPHMLARVTRSRAYFRRRGGWAIFLSRFLFSALGGTINLIAGVEIYPFPRFLLFDFSGELVGALIPLLLGYAFGASWEAVGNLLADISVLVTALVVAFYLAYLLFKMLRRAKTRSVKILSIPTNGRSTHSMENDFRKTSPILPPSPSFERIHVEDKFPMSGRDKFPTS